ncbi:MAG: pyrophosphokinae, partial [Burkholderiales bacterium]
MVSIAAAQSDTQGQLSSGLTAEDSARVMEAHAFVKPIYSGKPVGTGQDAFEFSERVATVLALLNTDADTRIASLLFELPALDPEVAAGIEERFGKEIADLVTGIRQLMRLHEQTFGQHEVARGKNASQQAAEQLETLRKMLLSMASDMRVVLVRLASRVTTLRYFADLKLESDRTYQYGR